MSFFILGVAWWKKKWVIKSRFIRGLEKSVGNIRGYGHGKNDAAWG